MYEDRFPRSAIGNHLLKSLTSMAFLLKVGMNPLV